MVSYQTTIVVPLKDCVRRTRDFLRHSFHDDFFYLFLDGSLSNANQVLLQGLQQKNARYVRYHGDHRLEDFRRKMAHGTSLIDTPLAVMVDAGDYVLKEGVMAAQDVLFVDQNLSSAGGDIPVARQFGPFISHTWPASKSSLLSGLRLDAALEVISSNYTHLWYAVQRSAVLQKSWSVISGQEIQHPCMEYLPTVCILGHGQYVDTRSPHILRVAHSPFNWTRWNPDDLLEIQRLDVSQELRRFGALCSKEFGVDAALVEAAFRQNADAVIRQLGGPRKISEGGRARPRIDSGTLNAFVERAVHIYTYYTPLTHGRDPSTMPYYRHVWSLRRRRLSELSGSGGLN